MPSQPRSDADVAEHWLERCAREAADPYAYIAKMLKWRVTPVILAGSSAQQIAFVRRMLGRIAKLVKIECATWQEFNERVGTLKQSGEFPSGAQLIATAILHKKPPFDDSDLTDIAEHLARERVLLSLSPSFAEALVATIARFAKRRAPSADLTASITTLRNVLASAGGGFYAKLNRHLAKIGLNQQFQLAAGEAWSDQASADAASAKSNSQRWLELLEHCASATASTPSARWTANATKCIDAIGFSEFRDYVAKWFPLVDQPRTSLANAGWQWGEHANQFIVDSNRDVLRGLAWCCGLREDDEAARALCKLAVISYKKLPGIGPRYVKIGNACVWALGNMPGLGAIGQLAILKTRVKFGTAQKLIAKAFDAAAKRAGLPVDEIEEMAVPAYGLDSVGSRVESFGEYSAEVRMESGDAVSIIWRKADGKSLKSAPAVVKSDHADDYRELTQSVKDLQRMLSAQRERLDSLFLSQRSWPLETWKTRYLDHPLIGVLARRLIWTFSNDGTSIDGVWSGEALHDIDGKPLRLSDAATVALWHPIGKSIGNVLSWRERLEQLGVQQPFKQAHREVYLLTDAERQTRTYSNRFAAHILRQHQFNALCAARGWKNTLRLYVDQDFPPATRHLPQWNLRAEYWVDGIGTEYGVDMNETGVFLRVATDQVRFYLPTAAQSSFHGYAGRDLQRGQPAEPMPLDQIPPLVFSEIMRDVDLFVGVASIGNDPTWNDGGENRGHGDYWRDYSFGELGETAKTRKAVLEKLIPRLAIAERCRMTDKFLVVRGDLRTYKIHLGSANILMEPNDQYLCIVPARGAAKVGGGRVFLPFEGDERLSVILSKAIMLAADTKIADPTIVSQIRRS